MGAKRNRWILAGLMFVGIAINYLDRVNISSGILFISKDLHLNAVAQGVILSAFSWGYVALMLPGGLLVDRYGARIMNAIACALWSVLTMFIAASNGLIMLVVTRFLVGGAEAPIFPGNAKLVSQHFPLQERGRATATFDVGSYVGGALSAPLVIFAMIAWGWRAAFVVSGLLGLIWSAIWLIGWLSHYGPPKESVDEISPRLRRAGRRSPGQPDTMRARLRGVPALLRQRKMLSVSLGFFCYNYLKSFFLTWFPTYLVAARGFTLIKVGLVSLVPPACAVVAELAAGSLTDRLISRGVNTSLARKLPLCLGLLVSSIVVISNFTSNQVLVVVLLSLSYASLIAASASIWAIPTDIAPSQAWVGTVGGIQNTFSNVAGIVAPIVTGVLYAATGSFVIPLLVSGVLVGVGAAAYWFGTGTLEPMQVPDLALMESEDGRLSAA